MKCSCSVLVSWTISCESPTELSQDLTGLFSLFILGHLYVFFGLSPASMDLACPFPPRMCFKACLPPPSAFRIPLPLTPRLLKISKISFLCLAYSALCGKDAWIESFWGQGDKQHPTTDWFNPRHLTCWACAWRCQRFRENTQSEFLVHLVSGESVWTVWCAAFDSGYGQRRLQWSGFHGVDVNSDFHVFCSRRVET